MGKRIWKRTGKNTENETEQRRRAKVSLAIEQMEYRAKLRERAADLPGRIGFFGLACFAIAAKPKPPPNELKEAIEGGAKLLEETNKCLSELLALKSTGPEAIKLITELKKRKRLLQRLLRRISNVKKRKAEKMNELG